MTAILEPDTVPAPAPAPVPSAAPAPPVLPPPVLAAREPRARRSLTATGIRLVGAAMLVLIIAADLLAPAADGAEPVRPIWLETLYTVQTLALLAAAAGFLLGRRWALGAGVLVSGIGAFNVAMCPASGHHVVAGWWFGQVALSVALLALPVWALLRGRAR